MGAEKAAAWREPEVTRDCGWGVPLVRVSGGGHGRREILWFRRGGDGVVPEPKACEGSNGAAT